MNLGRARTFTLSRDQILDKERMLAVLRASILRYFFECFLGKFVLFIIGLFTSGLKLRELDKVELNEFKALYYRG